MEMAGFVGGYVVGSRGTRDSALARRASSALGAWTASNGASNLWLGSCSRAHGSSAGRAGGRRTSGLRGVRRGRARLSMVGDDKGNAGGDSSKDGDNNANPSSSGDKQPPFEQPNENEFAKIPQSDVDWTSEWARFQSTGGRSLAGKGKSPTPKVVLQGRKAVNEARMSFSAIQWRQLPKDWRFWLALIVAVSLLTSFVQVSSYQSSGAI